MPKKAAKKKSADKKVKKEEKSFNETMKEFEEKMEEVGEKFDEEIEKQGDKFEKEIEKKIEKKLDGPAKRFGYFLTVIINIFILWTAHNVLNWDYRIFDFVQPEFKDVLWAIDLSISINILFNFIWIFYSEKVFKLVLQLISNAFGLLLMVVLLIVFPYDFRELIDVGWINTAMKVLFVIGMFGTIIGSIVEMAKTLWNLVKDEK